MNPTDQPTPTPETDAIDESVTGSNWSDTGSYHAMKEHAESLERERDAANAEREKLREALDAVTGKEAEGVAHDLDHLCIDRSKWYRAVKRARRLLSTLKP